MMRILSTLSFLVFGAAAALAAPGSSQFDAFCDRVAGKSVSFSYDYEVEAEVLVKGYGEACVSGDSYKVETGAMEFTSDGVVRWTVDNDSKEIYIESVDGTAVDYMTNPAALFASLKTLFKVLGSADVKVAGKAAVRYDLSPSKKGTGLDSLSVYLSAGKPVKVDVAPSGGPRVTFTITSYTEAEKSDARFSVDVASYGGKYLVTDLR